MSKMTDERASQAGALLTTAMALVSVAVGISRGVAWGFAVFGLYLPSMAIVAVAGGGGR